MLGDGITGGHCAAPRRNSHQELSSTTDAIIYRTQALLRRSLDVSELSERRSNLANESLRLRKHNASISSHRIST